MVCSSCFTKLGFFTKYTFTKSGVYCTVLVSFFRVKMKVQPILFALSIWIAIQVISKADSTRKNVILNELQISPADKFIEIKSEEASIALDGYSLVVMDMSKDRNKCGNKPEVKVRGVLSLQGKRTVDHLAFVGNIGERT